MLATPDSPLPTMRRAIAFTVAALGAAAEVDPDLTPEGGKVLSAERAKLLPFVKSLHDAEHALDEYDLGDGILLQARVMIGDAVLDRGVRAANAQTKLALQNKSGLGAAHVFGARVSELTAEKLRLEPAKVLAAVDRLEHVADFDAKKSMAKDLKKRAEAQESYLVDREGGDAKRGKLASHAVKIVADAADALAACKGALDKEFPRQRDFVASFFLDVTPARHAKSKDGSATPPAAAPPASPHA